VCLPCATKWTFKRRWYLLAPDRSPYRAVDTVSGTASMTSTELRQAVKATKKKYSVILVKLNTVKCYDLYSPLVIVTAEQFPGFV